MTTGKIKFGLGYHILVVDDEEKVAKFISEMLKNKGYTVTTLNSSREATDYFSAHKQSIDLVITDQTMPDITGAELAQSILNERPDQLIFLITGYSEEIDSEKAAEIGIKEYITKPLKLADLAEKLQFYLPAKEQNQTA